MLSVTTAAGGQASMALTPAASAYLEGRSITIETAESLGVYALKHLGTDCLAFPFLKDGKIVNHKYKNFLDKNGVPSWSQDKGGEQVVWNRSALEDQSLTDQSVIITEGEWDCCVAVQCGYIRSVSVPSGAPSQAIDPSRDDVSNKYAFVRDILPLLEECREIILCTDGDTNGQVLRDDLAIRLGRARCKFVTYPKECKDLNDALNKYGARGVEETIKRAKWYAVDGVFSFSQLPPLEDKPVYNLGMSGFDNHYKLRRGDFSVVTGVPSSGKSTFLNHMMCKVIKEHGMKVCFASFEQSPQTDHHRALRKWWYWSYKNITAPHKTFEKHSDAEDFSAWLDTYFRIIYPSWDDSVDIDWLMERMTAAVVQEDCDIVVIDPFNEMEHNTSGESMTLYIGWFIKTLKRFASKHNVHVIVVAHPRKINKDAKGNVELPTLYDIEQSAMWYNKADLGVIIHRRDGVTLARVAKSRYEDVIGKRGDTHFIFDEETAHFNEYIPEIFE